MSDSWVDSPLPKLLKSMKSGGTPDTSQSDFYGGEIPFVAIDDMTRCSRYLEKTSKTLTSEGLRNSNAWLVPAGALLYSIYATLGVPRINKIPVATNQAILALLNDPKAIDGNYLYYWLSFIRDSVVNLSSQTTQSNLSASVVKTFLVRHPESLPEQNKIAEILSTVDQAIEQTEALIAKQQRIKTGLMQDLLTRGIDENGNLRSEETHEFKDSPLGRIPVEWDLSELAYAFAEVPRNGIYKPPNQIGSGTVLIGQTSFTKERRIDYRFARRTIVSPSELKAYQLRNHDILVTRVFATVDGVGLPILVTDLPEAAVYESNMLRLRVDSAKSNPTLLFHWLRSSAIRKRVTASVNASNQTSINQTVLNALPALVIPSDEQDNIVAAISAQETYLNDLARNLGKLRSLKTALMQDLLTGKVSVAPLLTEEERNT